MPLDQLKQSIIDNLSRDKSTLDEAYLYTNGISYTKQQIITEISNDTPLGNQLIEELIGLTIHLLNRKKL